MVWCDVVRCGVVWCGVVGSGVVWWDLVWCDMVWCGLVCGVRLGAVVWCTHFVQCSYDVFHFTQKSMLCKHIMPEFSKV